MLCNNYNENSHFITEIGLVWEKVGYPRLVLTADEWWMDVVTMEVPFSPPTSLQ